MFRLEDSGERGGRLTISATAFDVLSVMEGLSSAVLHLEHRLEEYLADKPQMSYSQKEMANLLEAKIKDARSNLVELTDVLAKRNEAIE